MTKARAKEKAKALLVRRATATEAARAKTKAKANPRVLAEQLNVGNMVNKFNKLLSTIQEIMEEMVAGNLLDPPPELHRLRRARQRRIWEIKTPPMLESDLAEEGEMHLRLLVAFKKWLWTQEEFVEVDEYPLVDLKDWGEFDQVNLQQEPEGAGILDVSGEMLAQLEHA